jgi:hypothetical protein
LTLGGVALTFSSIRGRNSVVECQLPKLDVAGSSPVARSVEVIGTRTLTKRRGRKVRGVFAWGPRWGPQKPGLAGSASLRQGGMLLGRQRDHQRVQIERSGVRAPGGRDGSDGGHRQPLSGAPRSPNPGKSAFASGNPASRRAGLSPGRRGGRLGDVGRNAPGAKKSASFLSTRETSEDADYSCWSAMSGATMAALIAGSRVASRDAMPSTTSAPR